MSNTVRKGETKRLITLNAQTWWVVIKRIMKDNTQYCNKMQKHIVWKHLQAYVENRRLAAGLKHLLGTLLVVWSISVIMTPY